MSLNPGWFCCRCAFRRTTEHGKTAQAGMLLLDVGNRQRMRVNGEARIEKQDSLMAEYPKAQFIVRVRAREVFANCPRYIHKMQLIERSRVVPKTSRKTPVSGWKKGDWVVDLLPTNDAAHDKDLEVL